MLDTLTPEGKYEEQKKQIKKLIENYHLLHEVITLPEHIIPKVDLDMAIQSLDPASGELIKLTCLYGYTYREVEKMIGIPKSTIGDMKEKALEKIIEFCLEK